MGEEDRNNEVDTPSQRLIRFAAQGLFGYLDQDVSLAPEGVTILHGANGSGKTTLLRCLSDVSAGKWNALFGRPISRLILDFDSGSRFVYEISKDRSEVSFTYRRAKTKKPDRWAVQLDVLAHITRAMEEHGPYFRRTLTVGTAGRRVKAIEADDDFYPLSSPETWEMVKRLFPDKLVQGVELPPAWLTEFRTQFHCTLIEEQRLIQYAAEQDKVPRPARVVSGFSTRIADTIKDVSRQYGEKSQQLDRTFPQRLVNVLETKPPEPHTLQEKFNELEERRSRLESAGLIGAEASMMQLNPDSLERVEVRRLLSLYADDVAAKLSLFDLIYEKITLFQDLIKEYFSKKSAKITRKGITISSTATKQELDAAALSSGEQHIFVLFFRLIFTEPSERHLVLIDEPELSLHPRWQLRFVGDLERIRKVSPLDFMLASHSPQIFQGHLGLGRDLNI